MLRILLIDDNPDDRILTIRELNRQFSDLYVEEIIDAVSFAQALDVGNFDVAIVDFLLRWSDGLTVLRAFKSRYPDRPVVMFTASGSEEVAVEAMKAGLDDYVIKSPKRYSRLPAAVRLAWDRSRQQQALQEAERQRKQVQAALRDSEERLRLALEAAQMGTWEHNLIAGTTTYSEVTEQLFGLVPGTFDGTYESFLSSIHPEDQVLVNAAVKRAVDEGADYNIEFRIVRPDGAIVWLMNRGQVLYDDTGKAVSIMGVCLDITQHKQAEQERARLLSLEQAIRAQAEQAEYRAAFLAEASAVLVSSLDYETTLASVAHLVVNRIAHWCIIDLLEENDSIRRVVVAHANSKTDELVQQGYRFSPDLHSDHPIAQVMRSGEPVIAAEGADALFETAVDDPEFRAIASTLKHKPYTVVPIQLRGHTLGAIAFIAAKSHQRYTLRDLVLAEELSRRIAMAVENAKIHQEAQEANRLKDEFLAILSHELRTPLNAILGWARLLRTRQFDANTVERALETIERNARLQTQMIEDLLDVSRIIRGKLQLTMQPVKLMPLIEGVLDTIKPTALAKNIQIESRLNSAVGQVAGDSDRLQQILWNLLSNAIKFTPQGGRVEVQLKPLQLVESRLQMGEDKLQAEMSDAQITISDTGIGINPNFVPFVFDRFRQQNSSTVRSHNGLGLGLAIVRHLVELHGGTVSASSLGEGKGATFTVTLPLLNDAEYQVPSPEYEGENTAAQSGSGESSMPRERTPYEDAN